MVETDDSAHGQTYIVAEVVHEIDENSKDRASGMAGQLAGVKAQILSEVEILAMKDGSRILGEWEVGDDRRYDAENERVHLTPNSQPQSFRRLHSVKTQRD